MGRWDGGGEGGGKRRITSLSPLSLLPHPSPTPLQREEGRDREKSDHRRVKGTSTTCKITEEWGWEREGPLWEGKGVRIIVVK